MIVRKMDNPVFHRRKREGLPGRGMEDRAVNREKSFDQYLLEAFDGEVVRDGKDFSGNLSDLTRDNLIRLSQL
ncbi:MAG: hypothetical protein KDK30_13365 [Leptospiraceae bacterium]|nr:hypothetical protein [Leptospiraceae bacterium]MCB1322706.1 hypothetical protein [Leptospiraceae bacterium]